MASIDRQIKPKLPSLELKVFHVLMLTHLNHNHALQVQSHRFLSTEHFPASRPPFFLFPLPGMYFHILPVTKTYGLNTISSLKPLLILLIRIENFLFCALTV